MDRVRAADGEGINGRNPFEGGKLGEITGKVETILAALRSQAKPASLAGMARFGINTTGTLGGISLPTLRRMARAYRGDHPLALALWDSGVHEARILASIVDDPLQVTPEQMERWAAEFDSWDVCDQVCSNLFARTPHAVEKARAWSARPEEFVKRAGFTLIAALAVHARTMPDDVFMEFLPLIRREAADRRNFVRKAVNWALRQIGKRNAVLHRAAVQTAHDMLASGERAVRWVASDALRELGSEAVQERLARGARRTQSQR